MTTTILLTRHGETDWNLERRWQGQSDPPLNERGREQARALVGQLDGAPLDAVYASDLRRAEETARIVAEELGVPLHLDPRLREINAGSWEGFTADEIQIRWPEAHTRFGTTGEPGWEAGESYPELAERALAAVSDIAERHPGGTVLVVSHGGPAKAILMRAMEMDFVTRRRELPPFGNCELCRIVVQDGELKRLSGID